MLARNAALMRHQGFSLIELIATIAILAAIAIAAGVYIASYVSTARQRTEERTLATLNDALDRYKTQGGGTSSLTLGAPIANIINRLKQPVSWAGGLSHQVLNNAFTVPARSLKATGTGSTYRFYQYNTVTSNTPASGAATTDMPYGQGVGYLTRTGTSTFGVVFISSTTRVAIRNAAGTTTIVSAFNQNDWQFFNPGSTSYTFWSCASAVDSTPSGTITYLKIQNYLSSPLVSSLDLRGLTGLQSLLIIGTPSLTSVNLTGLNSLGYITVSGNAAISSITLPQSPSLGPVYVGGTAMTASTSALNNLYASLPDLSGGAANNLYIGTGAPSANDAVATAKGWTIFRSN
jgi:prepilin-type N-terminal cleavage/methylation domain-containing protein